MEINSMITDIILVIPVLIPLLAGILALGFWRFKRAQSLVTIAGSGLLLISGIYLLKNVYSEGILSTQIGSWTAPFGITFVSDTLSAVMVVLTGLISLAVSIYSITAIDNERKSYGYYPIYNILIMGVCGAFLTGDIFNLFVWFEVILISSFVLLTLGGQKPQIESSIKYVTLNLISSTLFLTAVGLIYGLTGTLNMADLAVQLKSIENTGIVTAISILFLVSFGIKSAIFPLFFWLPSSYHTPPVAVSSFFAGLLTKVGVYALIRIFTLIFVADTFLTHNLLLIIAGFTMLIGVLGAAAQNDFRRILSFHIISQIGYMVMGLALFSPLALAGSVFYIIHHIIVKANLFLVSGVVGRLKGTFSLKSLGGIYSTYPILAALFLIPALSLAGIPPLSGFWAKLTIIKSGLEKEEFIIVAVALFVGLLTLFSMTKIWAEVFWKEGNVNDNNDNEDKINIFSDSSILPMIIPIIMLAFITLFIGLYPEPVISIAERASEELLNPERYIEAVLGVNR